MIMTPEISLMLIDAKGTNWKEGSIYQLKSDPNPNYSLFRVYRNGKFLGIASPTRFKFP